MKLIDEEALKLLVALKMKLTIFVLLACAHALRPPAPRCVRAARRRVALPAAPAAAAAVRGTDPSKRLIFGLAFNAGLSDVTLLRKYGAFPTMMTGNTMKLTEAALFRRWADVSYFAAVIAAYAAGTAVYRRAMKSQPTHPARACAPVVLALFALSDALSGAKERRWVMLLLSSAFGMINSVSIEGQRTITNMLTGHMHKVTNYGTDVTLGDPPAEFGIANWRSVGVLGGFVGGAALGVILATLSPAFLARGCATALGMTYAAMLLVQDNMGRLALPEGLGRIYSG